MSTITRGFTTEQLLSDIEHAEEKAETLCGACAEDHARLAWYMRMLLAATDSKPVTSVIFKDGWPIPETLGIVAGSEKLPDGTHEFYAAPPAPVAVPDECPRSIIDAAEEFDSAEEMARTIWTACRSAMLNRGG